MNYGFNLSSDGYKYNINHKYENSVCLASACWIMKRGSQSQTWSCDWARRMLKGKTMRNGLGHTFICCPYVRHHLPSQALIRLTDCKHTFQLYYVCNHNMAFNGSLHGPGSLVQHTNLLGEDVIKFPSDGDVGNWAGSLCPAYNHSPAITGWLHLPCTHMPFIFMCLSGTPRQRSPFFPLWSSILIIVYARPRFCDCG